MAAGFDPSTFRSKVDNLDHRTKVSCPNSINTFIAIARVQIFVISSSADAHARCFAKMGPHYNFTKLGQINALTHILFSLYIKILFISM